MSTLRIAVMPGDGIGQEVIPEGLKVFDAALKKTAQVDQNPQSSTSEGAQQGSRFEEVQIEREYFAASAARWKDTGETIT